MYPIWRCSCMYLNMEIVLSFFTGNNDFLLSWYGTCALFRYIGENYVLHYAFQTWFKLIVILSVSTSHWAHNVVATLNQRHWHCFNVATTLCVPVGCTLCRDVLRIMWYYLYLMYICWQWIMWNKSVHTHMVYITYIGSKHSVIVLQYSVLLFSIVLLFYSIWKLSVTKVSFPCLFPTNLRS